MILGKLGMFSGFQCGSTDQSEKSFSSVDAKPDWTRQVGLEQPMREGRLASHAPHQSPCDPCCVWVQILGFPLFTDPPECSASGNPVDSEGNVSQPFT